MTESQRSAERSLTESSHLGIPVERQADLHPPHPPSPGTEEDKDHHDLAAWTAESSSTSEGQPQLRVNTGKQSRRSISDFRRSELETHTLNSWDQPPARNPSNPSSAGEGKPAPPKGRHKKRWPKVPFLRRPLSGDERPWLQRRQEASPWVNLFSDLAVASVLSAFGNDHDITEPKDIPDYLSLFSYFVIIQWIWATQTLYDVRFQAEDVVHRIYKAAQIYVYVYIGAASGNWELSKLRDPDSFPETRQNDYEVRVLASESYTTVLIAFLLSRVLLITQYALCAILGRKAKRKIAFQISSIAVLAVSTILIIVSLALPPDSQVLVGAKIFLLYLSIAFEMLMIAIQLHRRFDHYISISAIAERYGALTLVILGETGFNSLTKAFNRAISGLNDNSQASYAQVFLAIGIMVLLYLFLYSWFKPEEEVTERRALAWQAIHLPLHLAIILLLSAMVNTVVTISYAHGLDKVVSAYADVLTTVQEGTPLTEKQTSRADHYLSRLDLKPDWTTEALYLTSIANSTTVDGDIVASQYLGQIFEKTTQLYGLKLDEEANEALASLNSLNTTYATDDAERAVIEKHAARDLAVLLARPISNALSGTLWLFPCAGFVLIVAAIRSFLWYRLVGIDHYLIHGGMIVFGVVLGLLGLLDIGNTNVSIDPSTEDVLSSNVAPMYSVVVGSEVPLVIVLLVYCFAYFGAVIAGAWFRRRERLHKQRAVKRDSSGEKQS